MNDDLIPQILLMDHFDFDYGKLVYNEFESVIKYNTRELPIFSMAAVESAQHYLKYDSVDKDVLECYT